MTDIFYWTGLVAIFTVAFIAGQITTPEQTLKPVPIKIQGPLN